MIDVCAQLLSGTQLHMVDDRPGLRDIFFQRKA